MVVSPLRWRLLIAFPDATHVVGFGTGVLFSAGMLAGSAGVTTIVQREPPVDNRVVPSE